MLPHFAYMSIKVAITIAYEINPHLVIYYHLPYLIILNACFVDLLPIWVVNAYHESNLIGIVILLGIYLLIQSKGHP